MGKCGQPHPMRQHGDLRCDREAGHRGAHRAPLFTGGADTLEWSRRPEDACAPEAIFSPEAKSDLNDEEAQ